MVFLTTRNKKSLPTHVTIEVDVPSTALCESIQTVHKDRIDRFVRHMTPDEMKKVDEGIMCSLGLTAEVKVEKPVHNTAEIERDLYKNLYEQLLDRLTVRT